MDKSSIAVPAAIVIAAALIAGAIYLSGQSKGPAEETGPAEKEIVVRPVDGTDHIRGNPNAPIMIIEYSDYDCPFCSQFHTTMQRAVEKYGTTGKIAWVYRHFPLTQLHPNAAKIAAASECVAELGGNEAFWKFTDFVFNEKPVDQQNGQEVIGFTDLKQLPTFAERAGVNKSAFESCANSGKYDQAIQTAVAEALDAGGTGTPHTLIVAGNQVLTTLPGAIPFENYRGSSGEMQSGLDDVIRDLTAQVPNAPGATGTSTPTQ